MKLTSDKITMANGTEIPNTPEAIKAHSEANRDAFNRTAEALRKRNEQNTGKFCPINRDAHINGNIQCRKDCALYRDGSCAFSSGQAVSDTKAKSCPLRRKCDEHCALYDGGCTLNFRKDV